MLVQRLRHLYRRLIDAARSLFPQRSRSPRPDTTATFDGQKLCAHTTENEAIEWLTQEFEEIGIQTTAAGPFIEDVFWVIQSQGKTVCIPQESVPAKKLLEYAPSLEGFDWEPFIQAMASTGNQYFRCWKKRQ